TASPSVHEQPPRPQLDYSSSTTERPFCALTVCPGHAAHIYHHDRAHIYHHFYLPWSVCAYFPSRKTSVRIFTITSAHIYHHVCAYLPSRLRIFTITTDIIHRV